MYKNLLEGDQDTPNNLHRLIVELLQTIHKLDTKKSLEAAKCLGEMGPQNLNAIVLELEDINLNNIHPGVREIYNFFEFLLFFF